MSNNSKSISSDDELLLDSELTGVSHKKHFLDYDYDHQPPLTTNNAITVGDSHAGKIHSASQSKVNNNRTCGSSSINNNESANNNTTHQLDQKKKITPTERPSTSSINSNIMPTNVDSVYSILSMLGSFNSSDITSKFLEFSKNREMCAAMRLSGCISLLVQIIHSDSSDEVRQKECLQTLHNIIHCHPDDKAGRREARVLKLIEQLFDYCDALRSIMKNELSDNVDRYPIQSIGTLMKISFDEEHRYAMCQLGALQTIATLIQLDHTVHGSVSSENNCVTMRRYAGMCLTNLTFGDGNNKALLCSNKNFMRALVEQINSSSDELVQVTASIIRNLSWRADANMKEVLNEIGTVKILTLASMKCTQENTLKAILSALWNLSNHCAKNKAEFCEIDGAIEFLVDMLLYDAPSKTMTVIENAGGILRNISSHIAIYEEHRMVLRRKNCFNILLQQLKSPSLTVVSNACGTLGNLSAHCPDDQKYLRDNGAIPMLRSLIYSKHKMISTGSTIALRHLLACKANVTHNENLDSVAKMMDLKELPTLNVRKQRALEHELNLSTEHYEIDDTSPSTKDDKTKDFSVTSKMKVRATNDIIKVHDIEDDDEEAPTNFSKFDNDQEEEGERSEYQETNLDQITDYSIRYAENQLDSDEEVQKPVTVLSADDATKCYNTEGTPHTVLSGATSMTDLRKEKLKESIKISEDKKLKDKFSASASGVQTPEKTVNYCVEGTPGNFSRNDSLSDLEENPKSDKPGSSKTQSETKIPPPLMIRKESSGEKESVAATPKSVTFGNLAEETPLMFSRTSSMGSLSSAEPACVDDKSSVFSDFSRMASGIISPSELPDSPTQSIPHSPSRLQARSQQKTVPIIRTPPLPATREVIGAEAEPAEDSTNMFNIENTPAVFSYATSLSNLSFDDEPKISTDAISKDFHLMKHPSEDEENKLKNLPIEGNFAHDISQPPDTAEQSDAESAEDDYLLESCINMGMNRVATRNEPAKEHVTGVEHFDNGSSTSDADDHILEACIRDGMPKFPTQLIKENPVDMMRSGAPLLPPYFPVVDELNRFIVEDSPCNFSVMSGLSAITIESNMMAGQQVTNKPIAKVEPTIREDGVGTSRKSLSSLPPRTRTAQEFDDSLSSLSIESEDDGNLLSQAIAAGVNAKPVKFDGSAAAFSNPINIPAKPRHSTEVCNDSISSVDSSGKDDATNSILEQCIQSGINKVVKKESRKQRDRPLVTSSPKKSMLPTYSKPGPSKPLKIEKKELARKDEELLQECITTGIMKSTNQDQQLPQNFNQLSISDPKNAKATSVIVKDVQHASTITGVEAKVEDPQNNSSMKFQEMRSKVACNSSNFSNNSNTIQDLVENIDSKKEPSHQGNWTKQNGCSSSFELHLSLGSIDDNILERSNEYPAAKLSMGAYGEIDDDSVMEMSNEFMIDNQTLACEEAKRIEDKHKDPDLMLKSVDRLTHELISTAEYLRRNVTNSDELSEPKMSNSISNNTWNDDNSFPSISMSAPMIGSTNDEVTIATDQISSMPEEKPQSINQLDDKTPTNENYRFGDDFGSKDLNDGPSPSPRIDFKVGGEIGMQPIVTSMNFMSFGPTSIETCSTMSNSTIVQVEAKRIANKITSMTSRLMDSTNSLDLENVRPPSSMDCISLTSYAESAFQTLPLNIQPKKSLVTGLIAKRALGQRGFGGSVESITSLNNIENIRPPSIMDELLDSMISVDSIVSEVVDPTTMGFSNYETALSDMEDSMTLRSCQDLSHDDTLTPSDISSVESTPKRKRNRSVTPKQKRQSEKDRYKTYTIAVDMLLKEQQGQNSSSETRRSLNARQRRQEDRQRFETQVIDQTPEPMSPVRSNNRRKEDPERFNTRTISSGAEDEDFSIQAMTSRFHFLQNGNISSRTSKIDTAGLKFKLNRIKFGVSSPAARINDDSLEYERQNSETESQRDLKNSLNYDANSSTEKEIDTLASTPTPTPVQEEPPKIKQTKSSYISPYRMTTKLTPTKSKSVKLTKTPVIAKIVNRNPPLDLKTSPAAQKSNGKANGIKNRTSSTAKVMPVNTTNIPKAATTPTLETPAIAPIRQGTFIKDEPSIENVPVVDLPPSPVKTSVSRLKPPTRVSTSASKIPTTPTESKNTSPKKSILPSSISQMKYRSNSNASMKTTDLITPIRSNTGINLNNPKRNVTSKIAGIWKSPEKKEHSLKKPISTSSSQLNYGSKVLIPVVPNGKRIVNVTKDKMKRSSTCEQIP